MATANLVPTSQDAAGGWTDEAGGASNLHLVIDETSAGTDYLRGVLDAATTVGYFGLTPPATVAVPTAVTLNIRHSRGGVEGGDNGGGNDTHTLFARLWSADHGTALTAELTVETGTVGYLVKTENIAMGSIAGTNAQWQTPHLALRTTFTQASGKDGDRMWVDFANVDITYTPAFTGTVARTNGGDTSAGSGAVTAPAVTGSVAVSNAADTLAGSGVLGYSGSAGPSGASDAAAASGLLGYSGTVDTANSSDIVAATGGLGYSGTVAVTVAADTVDGSGSISAGDSISGTVAFANLPDVSRGIGKIRRPLTKAECCPHHGNPGHVCLTRNPEPLFN